MLIYLYVKTHNKTGLKYLGKTVKKDPHAYRGSGAYWKLHLKKHGADYTTEIIRECRSLDELEEWGLFYSNLWNVVESENWANLKPEVGDGGSHKAVMNSPSVRKKISEGVNRPESIAAISCAQQKLWANPDYKSHQSEVHKVIMNTPEVRDKIRKTNALPHVKEKRKNANKGAKNPNYDATVYRFYHKNGAELLCTRYHLWSEYKLDQGAVSALIAGRVKSVKGWRLLPPT